MTLRTAAHRQPLQERSRDSYRRLLGAAEKLFQRRGYDEVRVQEIAEGAGLTVGAFYARFASKEAFLHHLEQGIVEEWERLFDDWTREQTAGDLEALIRGLVTRLVDVYRRNLGVMRVLLLRSRSDAALRGRLKKLGGRSVGDAAALIFRERKSMRHPDPVFAVEFGSLMLRCTLRETVLFGARVAKKKLADPRLVDELVRMYLMYLGYEKKGRRGRQLG